MHEDWKNNDGVDLGRLTAVPVYLETVKDAVDLHLKRFIETASK